jgi:pyruvate/2-oxoglutarate dehydrogenase complex dihydrolipoamide acyltransferase (E2) component
MPTEAAPVVVPRENVNDESVTLVAWLVEDGAHVEEGQPIAQVETSKTVVEIAATASGTLHHAAKAGDDVAIGATIGRIGGGSGTITPPPAAEEPTAAPSTSRNGDHAPAVVAPAPPVLEPIPSNGHAPAPRSTRLSKRAQELIAQLGIDPATFAGRGLVRSRDLMARPAPTAEAPPRVQQSSPRPSPASGVATRSESLSRAKRTEARYLRSGSETTLSSSVTVTCPTLGFRDAAGDRATAVILHEAARLLRKYPAFNAYHDDGKVCYYEDVNIGLAVDAGRGLKVPVIRRADVKGIGAIADEVRELVVAYLGDELPVEALAGGTFTVTDLSGEGVSAFRPLINQGQSAILGVCAEVFPHGGRVGRFDLTLAFDHQLAEGRTAARFLNDLRERLGHFEASLAGEIGTAPKADTPAVAPDCSRCGRAPGELEAYGQYLVQTVRADGSSRLLCTRCLRGY